MELRWTVETLSALGMFAIMKNDKNERVMIWAEDETASGGEVTARLKREEKVLRIRIEERK